VSRSAAPEGATKVEPDRATPRHVAIIMDGNGRWAEQRGLPRVAGHKAGAEAVRRAMQAAVDHGVEVLTLYAFSSENWRRSEEEIADLTGLMRFYLERELKTLQKERVRLKLIGGSVELRIDLPTQRVYARIRCDAYHLHNASCG